MKKFLIACTVLFSGYLFQTNLGLAQPGYLTEGLDQTDFYAIQQALNQYYDEHPGAPGYKQWKRKEYYLQTRLGANGRLINTTARNVREWGKYLKSRGEERSTHGAWLFYGPNAITDIIPGQSAPGSGLGRINTIKIHPILSGTIYVGSSSGGIWKSTTGGSSWSDISPHLPSLAIKDIVIHPTNPGKIFALTGDGFNNAHPSIGIIKSLDGGSTWYPTNAPIFTSAPYKLIMHPTTPTTQYASTADGLYMTTDDWNSWTQLLFVPVYDLEFKPDDPSVIYIATSTNIQKRTGSGPWETLTDPDFSTWPSPRYIRIAVSADHPDCIYAFVSSSGGPVGLYRSLSAGQANTWSVQDATITNIGGNGWYNQTLEVHYSDYEHVTIGQVWTKISRSGGTPGTWVAPVNYVHADVHNSLFRNSYLYHVNDGGVFRSMPGDSTFTDLSTGLGIMEIYGIAGTPQNLNLYYCGTQDNGTNRRTTSNHFDHVSGNDGGNCMIDYTNSNNVYATYQNGFLRKSTDGGQTFFDINPPGTGAWVAPLLMDPVNPQIIFIGKDTLFRSNAGGNAGTWVNLGKTISIGGNFRSLAQGTNNRERIYASNSRFATQKMYKINDALMSGGNPTWIDITNELPAGTITGTTVNPDNADHVYVCLSNIDDGNKVFRSLSAGNPGSWENISGSLPNVAMNCIAFHDNGLNNNAVYVGTDIGVFYRDDDLGDWVYFSNNMPVVNVLDLYINTNSNIIAAGTYGKGIYISALYSDCANTITLVNSPSNPAGGVRYHSANNSITSSVEHRFDLGTEVHYTSGGFIDMQVGFVIGGEGFFDGKIGPCPPPFTLPGFTAPEIRHPFDIETWLQMANRGD